MSWIFDLGFTVVGAGLGEFHARRKSRVKSVKHKHAWDQWEFATKENGKPVTDTYNKPIQERRCLGCGKREREVIDH